MIALLPTRTQWKTWSKPTKYEFVGLVVAILALFSVPERVSRLLSPAPAQTYNSARKHYVDRLSEASTCLAARLYYDGLHPLESDCKIDVKGLTTFAGRFAPYMAVTPYSGAWNLKEYAARVEADIELINSAPDRRSLMRLQRTHKSSFAETAYYLCGLEWYLRSSPPSTLPPMLNERVATYQTAWLSWSHESKARIAWQPFESTEFEVKDDSDCSSFIDLLD